LKNWPDITTDREKNLPYCHERLTDYAFRYDGKAITWDSEGNEQPIEVASRIIVDTDSFNRFAGVRRRMVLDFNARDKEMLGEINKLVENGDRNFTVNAVFSPDGDQVNLKDQKPMKLSPYHQMLCRSRTRGYSLKIKRWLEFFVPLVGDIVWNEDAFDRLVLPDDQKELVLSFSESQVQNRAAFDDVISGKGRGIIMLLSGPPGVGKTLTA
jgi:hypothetical protein